MPGSVDNYLEEAVPLLQSYWNAVYEITNQKLVFQKKALPEHDSEVDQILQIHFDISVPVEFPEVMKEQKSGIPEANRPDIEMESDHVKSNKKVLYLIEHLALYNRKLQNVVTLELQDVHKERVKTLTEVNKIVDEFTEVLEKIKACYTTKSLGCPDVKLPSINDIKVVTDKVVNLKNDLNQDYLSAVFKTKSDKFTTSYENVWCSILGLNDEFGNRLLELDDKMKKREPWHYFIKNFIEREENVLTENGYPVENGRDGLIKTLQKIGFTKERAEVIAESIPGDLIDAQLPSYWAVKHLDFELLYHPLLTNLPRYSFKDGLVNVWFEEKVASDKPSEAGGCQASSDSDLLVKMINVKGKKGETLVDEFLREQRNEEEYALLFHGTDHSSAMSILQDGIKLTEGNKKLDFSDGHGFYVGEDFKNARRWKSGAGHQAVLVYKVKKDFIDPDKEGGMDVTIVSEKKKWERIVTFFRKGIKDKELQQELEKVTFIRGPMSLNGNSFMKNREPLKGFGRGDIQICIRDETYARKFGSIQNVACVIFY